MMYGDLIRDARKRKGWTQSDLAYKLGITPAGIVQWEQSRRNPKFETRQKIARALDIDITELMLKPEKEEYEKKYGDSESRASFAAYEIEKIIESNTRQVELCNGVVTTEHERKWALEHLEEMAGKHCVSTGGIKKQLNNDLSLGLEETSDDAIPEEKTYYKGGTVKGGMIREIEIIVATMNEDGREALLRHARELAQIPAYQRETENL